MQLISAFLKDFARILMFSILIFFFSNKKLVIINIKILEAKHFEFDINKCIFWTEQYRKNWDKHHYTYYFEVISLFILATLFLQFYQYFQLEKEEGEKAKEAHSIQRENWRLVKW